MVSTSISQSTASKNAIKQTDQFVEDSWIVANVVDLSTTSLKASSFKCFSEESQGFDRIAPVNVIIGRNNSGKSSLIDLLEYAATNSDITTLGHKGQSPTVIIKFPMTEKIIGNHLSKEQVEVRSEDGRQSWHFTPKMWAQRILVSTPTYWHLSRSNQLEFVDAPDIDRHDLEETQKKLHHVGRALGSRTANPFWDHVFRRIAADRDIVPEPSSDVLNIAPNGAGLTNAVARYIHVDSLNRDIVEVLLLRELNAIFRPDAEYTRILVQQRKSGVWEIFLEEAEKGRIALSQTGSGLKTVLLVLANLLLVPRFGDSPQPLEKFFFAFEEIENNLHPAVQRRLFAYLRRRAVEERSHIFVTTHSSVVIDLFSRDDQAQILHVTHDGKRSTVATVQTSEHGGKVLDDLDVRASDLLQTNVVVWVEGPSDRIYFNAWINLWTNGQLAEGLHYQCVPYGGSIGAHLTFERPEDVEDMIAALKINRHAILLIDSDKRNPETPLKKHAVRLLDEVERVGGYGWVTAGNEVENYIPLLVLKLMLKNEKLVGPGGFGEILTYIAKRTNKAVSRKTDLAEKVKALLTRDAIAETLDLADRLDAVTEKIKQWNRIEDKPNAPA